MSKMRPDPPPPAASGEKRSGPPLPMPAGEKKPAPPAAAEPKPKAKPKAREPSPWAWGLTARIVVSGLAIFHLVAVFTAPWYIQLRPIVVPAVAPGTVPLDAQGRPIPPEQFAERNVPLMEPALPLWLAYHLRHYTNLLYINNGYDFFSPDPTASHVIRYEVFSESGEALAEGKLPDRREHWPRLFYHRHMMLVEQSRDPATEGAGWEYAIARELLKKHAGDRIRLTMVRHHLLTPRQVLAGERVDGASTYQDLGVLEYPPPGGSRAEPLPGGGR